MSALGMKRNGMSHEEAGKLGYEKIKETLLQSVRNKSEALQFQYRADPKICECCKSELPYEQRWYRFCSRSCSATVNNAERPCTPKPVCPICNSSFERHKRSRFCSRKCQLEAKQQEKIRDWRNGKNPGGTWCGVSTIVRRWLFQTRSEQCELCGWKEVNPTSGKIPLQVDHIDGNPYDHSENNLRILCPNCHSLTPHFGALNKGRGRAERYKTKDTE